MLKTLCLLALLVSTYHFSFAETSSTNQPTYTAECLKSPDTFPCLGALHNEKSPAKIAEIIKVAGKDCLEGELKMKNLSLCLVLGTYSFSQKNDVQGIKFLQRDCPRNPPSCIVLSAYYIEHGDEIAALDIASRNCKLPRPLTLGPWIYVKSGENVCTSILQTNKLPKEFIEDAHERYYSLDWPGMPDPNPPKPPSPEESAKECLDKQDNCYYALKRNLDNKSLALEIANQMSQECFNHKDLEDGFLANYSCSEVSGYFFDHNETAKAIDLLKKGCETDSDACAQLARFYMKNNDDEKAVEAASLFCKVELTISRVRNQVTFEVAEKACPGLKSTHKISKDLREYLDGSASYFEYDK